ncbi:MAG: NAD-dependent succinate-semialdehyde dehydrogenase [Coxiellaceae bacterium]|nr:NAD-dependent succinate-semialdehyde dehydrogenase [Coxiellaceae bacterium]
MLKTINPVSGEHIATYDEMAIEEINPILESLDVAQRKWSQQSFSARAEKLLSVSEMLGKQKESLALLMAMEMGKPLSAGIAEIEKCQWVCEFYANSAENYCAPKIIQSSYEKSEVIYQPLGIIFAIMPWNFPFWQVFRFAAPNLMAGNAGVLSHASIVTGCGLAIEKIFLDCGVDVFRSLVINHDTTKNIIENPLIKAVTLTGSERAGKIVGSYAANALKKVVLELGGSDPYIVLADADLEKAADNIVKSRMNNAGQVCISAKRIIVIETAYKQLLALIFEKLKYYVMGDPLQKTTTLGPLARSDLRDTVHQQVQESLEKGASLLCGGQIPIGKGFYYPPTILENVKPGMPAFDDEIFGPVIAMIAVKDEAEALLLANKTRFGLSAAVFTRDIIKGEYFARALEVGTCAINSLVSSDPRLPFGGIKSSGYGRELAEEGIHEFMNIKTMTVAK